MRVRADLVRSVRGRADLVWSVRVRADLGGSPVILMVAASGRVPSQASVRGQGPGEVLAHLAGAALQPVVSALRLLLSGRSALSGLASGVWVVGVSELAFGVLLLWANSVSSAGISPVSWKVRQVSNPG